ncbi:MAG: hypothetical protein ACI8U4_001414 [Natronomonas sp.]|jgi:hypothetical protein
MQMRQSLSTLVVVVTLVTATAGLAMAPAAATGPDVTFAQDDGMNETETMDDGDSMDDDGMNETETMSDDDMDDDMEDDDSMAGEEEMDDGGFLPVSTGVGIAAALVVLGAGGVAALRLR